MRPAFSSFPKRLSDKENSAVLLTECHILTQVHSKVRKVEVSERESGQRIDNFLLKQLSGIPKSAIYRILRKGEVRVNGGRVKPERKLELGDEVRIPPVRLAEKGEAVRPPDSVLNRLRESIIHEDDQYLAINKPAGFASHGGTGVPYGVIESIRAWGKYTFIELCHRLDRDTSGVLLLAKTRPALLRAQRAFKNSLADKRYFALVVGRWRGEDRDVDAALLKSRLQSGERFVEVDDEDGKPSKSRFSPKARYKDYTLMEVSIFSGRTHQIRVHSLALGHPVAGDEKYGEREVNLKLRRHGLKRMFLHSHYLKLAPDETLPKLIVSAPMPDELRSFMSKLGPGR
jgi:23S rRNA pseudouridine955/2504/2580 synthase